MGANDALVIADKINVDRPLVVSIIAEFGLLDVTSSIGRGNISALSVDMLFLVLIGLAWIRLTK